MNFTQAVRDADRSPSSHVPLAPGLRRVRRIFMHATAPHQISVSFVVPCYKLGHLLAECLNSILSQSFRDFEILIMDDCSPDQTPEVARSFTDPRVRYVRNETNLGNLRNYNKGIGLARGNYIWLISADDRLRRTYVLER